MKPGTFALKLLYVTVLLAIAAIACTKTEIVTVTVQQPAACFTVQIPDPYFGTNHILGSSTFIDSNFYFRNCSDSGTNITYRWNFGDGTSSTEKNPRHKYARRGAYSVSLIVANADKAFDTARQTLTAVLGQQHITFGDGVNLNPIAIEETATNEFVLLGSKDYSAGYYLFQLDSQLQQKSMKAFPASYRLTSMQATADGYYIFTGSTQSGSKSNEIMKVAADGTQQWFKILSNDDTYSYAAPATDGGYVVVGARPVRLASGNIVNNTVVIKTDKSGIAQWQKTLDQEGMMQSRDAVVEQDGIVVAGVKQRAAGACLDCDSLLILKLDNTGKVVWSNTVFWGLNTNNWWNTRITKLTNGNYVVTNEYTRGLFFFSPSGIFLDRLLAPYQVSSVISSGDGGLIVLQTEYGNGLRINVAKLSPDGAQQWYANPDGRQKVANGYSCCSNSWPVALTRLRTGGVLVTGYRVDDNSTNYSTHNNILLLELDEAGKVK